MAGPGSLTGPRPSPDGTGRDFFRAAVQAFERAAERCGQYERCFAVAGRRVVFRFAGQGLASLLPRAFEHLEVPGHPAGADLTLRCWDTATTGVAIPDSPWDLSRAKRRGPVIVPGDEEHPAFVMANAGLVSLLETRTGQGVYWARSPEEIPVHEQAAPCRPLFHVWLRSSGLRLMHAAAVARGDRAVLLVGKGGSGKSATTLICLVRGLSGLGDDFCVVDPLDRPEPRVFSLYGSAKVDAQFAARMPGFASDQDMPGLMDSGKAVVFLPRLLPSALVPSAGIKAVVVPRITGREDTRLVPIPAGEALQALAASTLLLLPESRGDDLEASAGLVRRLPCFRIELGTRLEDIPGVVSEAIDRGGA